jgi:hypothetical protein
LAYSFLVSVNPAVKDAHTIPEKVQAGKKELDREIGQGVERVEKEVRSGVADVKKRVRSFETPEKSVPAAKPGKKDRR